MGVELRSRHRRSMRRIEGNMGKSESKPSPFGNHLPIFRYSITILVLVSLILGIATLVTFFYGGASASFSSLPRADRAEEVLELANGIGVYGYEVVHEYEHDPAAFTQGLLYDGNDTFYESTGLYGRSSVRKVDVQSGKVLQQQRMDHSLFGEGLTLWGSWLLQVTWLSKKGLIYDQQTLKPLGSFNHPMQDGWGLTTDGDQIIGSDGSANLYFMDPSTFTELRKVTVKDEEQVVRWLNELEYVQGEIWANVWQTECIARIKPNDGRITGWILMHGLRSALLAAGAKHLDVLNGIAWDGQQNRLFVTGKQWPKVYEIRLIDRRRHSSTDLNTVRRLCIR